ncbi:cytochrome-c peroxidase [Rhizobium leguminosarum]|uniref:cytochrome-c peroxidase n=1 Tax=Rhizobium leguminosarum TaxID=384 RepID=UPI001038A39C|nr:cytochrome c peroxidase [Rhizobium leguminosarum]TCA01025.1 cytochrome-c peroxidase [Rhizobium leguminosarum bv. viciae]TCA13781.1 cytochrome-c peroxidase [Rhizobium leguminosarum bv. viciae]
MKLALLLFLVVATTIAAMAQPFKVARPLGLIEPDIPLDRPLTPELVDLGKKLFFDSSLSRTGTTSCATCHDPKFGYADPRPRSISDGGLIQDRNAPSLYNVGFLPSVMWDGRFRTLDDQVLDAFNDNGEMGRNVDDAVSALKSNPEYVALFRQVFNEDPTAENLAAAVASFERTLVAGNSPFDYYLFGENERALTSLETTGLEVFSTKGGCLNCHDVFHPKFNTLGGGLALFSDFRYHNLGVGYQWGRFRDPGRYEWSRDASEWGEFRTPFLRNLTLTAPYMHDGSMATLDEVVDFYNRGGNPNPNLSPSVHPLYLTSSEKAALVAFLKSLTSPEAETVAHDAGTLIRPWYQKATKSNK